MQDNRRTSMWRFIPARDRTKLIFMLITLFFLVGIMYLLLQGATIKTGGGNKPASAVKSSPASTDAAGGASTEQIEQGEGPAMAEAKPKTDDTDLYDPEILKEVQDNTDTVAKEGLVLLIHSLQGKKYEELVPATNTGVFLDDLFQKPAENRGKLVYVDGELSKIKKTSLGANSTGVDAVYFGSISVPGRATRTVCFYLLDGPLGTKAGERVQLRGYFLSLWKHKEQGQEEVSPVLIGRRFDPPAWLSEPATMDLLDEGGFLKEQKPIYYTINKLAKMTPADVAAAADKTVSSMDLRMNPLKLRGKIVSFVGTLRDFNRVTDPNPTGVNDYYWGNLTNKQNHVCFFYILDVPDNVYENDLVRLDGIFVKNYRYVNRKNLETEASIIVGRTLAPMKVDATSVYVAIFAICGIVFIGVALAAGIAIRDVRRAADRHRRNVIKEAPDNLSWRARQAARKAKGDGHK